MQDKLELLLTSYDLSFLLEENDITEYTVLEMLVRKGLIDLTDYFEEDEDDTL